MAEQSGNILLLEKDAQTANAIADRLVAQGYYVEISQQVDPSLDGDIDDDVDVVLCDLDLPDISWEGVFDVLSERQQGVSAIMLSSHEQVVDVMTALRLGFRDFFHKPIDDWDALLSSVARCAEESRLRRENAAYRAKLEGANAELRGTVQVLEQDQQAGRHVQMRMLPQSPVEIDGYRFSHSVIPSLYLSGDYTDYFRVGENHAVFVISDVSGHGSSSAFVTVLLKNLLARKRSDFIHRDDNTIMDPAKMLDRANRDLLELGIGKFATVVIGVIDLYTGMLRYSIAGHLPLPVLVTPEGAQYLRGEGTAVGIMEEAEYEEHSIELPAEFMLALFTDGILEILPPDNLVDKEKHFLEAFSGGFQTPMQVSHRLGLDQIDIIPDDIAALYLERRGS
ncbi:MAG: SpoIIE family protein phosphatase [Halieaceae bacterium]|nr:SpoIIE family protein phosphatase [Halieaceae bacterium]